MKTKLFLGVLSAALLLGAPISVSVHRNDAKAISATQTAELQPNVNDTTKPVDVVPSNVNENTSDTTTPPVTVKPTHTIPASIGTNGTPLPEVTAITPDSEHRDDGFDNMCYRLDDGSFTTVQIKDYSPSPNLFPYLGDIDVTTGAPATAVGSQQWCAAHDPQRQQ